MSQAADSASESASQVSELVFAQTSKKWGTESGPSGFSTAYSEALWTIYDALNKLSTQLDAFVAGVQSAAAELSQCDSDSAGQQTILQAQADQNYKDTHPVPLNPTAYKPKPI